MLISFALRDFVIVDRLDLEFAPGFTVLTGETGAGKSILVDALSLALGARGDAGMVRQGCDKAEISADFSIIGLQPLRDWLVANELADAAETCLLRRILYADGRSRAFINGIPATMQQLREVGDFLVDITSQHIHHSLLKGANQRDLLDDAAASLPLAAEVAAAYRQQQALEQRCAERARRAATDAAECALLRDQVRELAQLGMSEGEWETVQAEQGRLAHAASLLEGCGASRELLAEGDAGIQRQLHVVQRKMQELREFDPALQEVLDGLESAVIQVEEVSRFLQRYLERAELDPERLREVEARMEAVHAAARKYRVQPEELIALLTTQRARLEVLAGADGEDRLAEELAAARAAYTQLARRLSAKREEAAAKLGQEVSARMQQLGLVGGQFAVALPPVPDGGLSGLEQVEFLVSGHAGAELRPLARVASGGELSRISLALRVVTAQRGETPTMIFDEVDVGIGGGVAEIVGQLLRKLGETRQVLVITHLPQVAALGGVHWRVSKEAADGQALSRIVRLDSDERIGEVARMLGGVQITETTRRHAAEMLGSPGA